MNVPDGVRLCYYCEGFEFCFGSIAFVILCGLLTGNSDVILKPDGMSMEFIDYYANAKNYNEIVGFEAFILSDFMGFWAVIVMIGTFIGLVLNLVSMKLYYGIAMRHSTMLHDRLNAMYAAMIKLGYISFQFGLNMIGAISVRKANQNEQISPFNQDQSFNNTTIDGSQETPGGDVRSVEET